jgi:hypothetical protein
MKLESLADMYLDDCMDWVASVKLQSAWMEVRFVRKSETHKIQFLPSWHKVYVGHAEMSHSKLILQKKVRYGKGIWKF